VRNRVTPAGDIVDIPLRGAWTGNRGVLHDGREIVRFHAGDLWITCALTFRDRWREQWLPNRYTHLFFHDEAVSFAAGHRPCGECRRPAYTAYRDASAGPSCRTACSCSAAGTPKSSWTGTWRNGRPGVTAPGGSCLGQEPCRC
jgi:hypothetical protein